MPKPSPKEEKEYTEEKPSSEQEEEFEEFSKFEELEEIEIKSIKQKPVESKEKKEEIKKIKFTIGEGILSKEKLMYLGQCLAYNEIKSKVNKMKKVESFAFEIEKKYIPEGKSEELISYENKIISEPKDVRKIHLGMDVTMDWITKQTVSLHKKNEKVIDPTFCPTEDTIIKELNRPENIHYKEEIDQVAERGKCRFIDTVRKYAFYPLDTKRFQRYTFIDSKQITMNNLVREGVIQIAGDGSDREKGIQDTNVIGKLYNKYNCGKYYPQKQKKNE